MLKDDRLLGLLWPDSEVYEGVWFSDDERDSPFPLSERLGLLLWFLLEDFSLSFITTDWTLPLLDASA